jgi:hypothetical protein
MSDLADLISDDPLRPDQYRHLIRHEWALRSVSLHLRSWRVLDESLSEEWVPADPARDWVRRAQHTGQRRWLQGSHRSAVAHGFDLNLDCDSPRELRARYGDYYAAEHSQEPAPPVGSWQNPTESFLASLPREPGRLLERLRVDSPTHDISFHRRFLRYPAYVGPWEYALDLLRTGLVSADVRSALYGALRLLPGVRVRTDASNLDGAKAIAVVLDSSPIREELFLDPHRGCYVGERTTVAAWTPAMPVRPGTVIRDTALRTTIVDGIDKPSESV